MDWLDVRTKQLDEAAKKARAAGDYKREKELLAESEKLLEDAAYEIMQKQFTKIFRL